ncbi:peptidase C15, partial [Campylobacter jejuni]|nr:peptidase C15 [Campylobacter jejuni]
MRILFTGFDPFGGEKINPAGEAVKMMKNDIQGAEILKLEVPTVFGKAGEVLKKAVEQYRPDAVVCVGQAGGRAAITPEMITVNIMDARIPDNAGNKPCHELIIKEGREAYFSSLPVKDI